MLIRERAQRQKYAELISSPLAVLPLKNLSEITEQEFLR